MNKYFTIGLGLVLIAMTVWLAGCSKEDNNSLAPTTGVRDGVSGVLDDCPIAPNGMLIKTSGWYTGVTATCFNRVSWEINVAALSNDTLECESNLDIEVPYTVDATHSVGLEGQICFENEPADQTANDKTCNTRLTILLEYNPPGSAPWTVVKTWVIGEVDDINSGEVKCYDYSVLLGDYVPVQGGQYRITPQLSIDNHGGAAGDNFHIFETHQDVDLDCYFGAAECGELTVSPECPASYTSANPDAVADFTCTIVSDPATATYTDDDSGSFVINIANGTSTRMETFNTQVCVNGLTSCDEQLSDCAALQIYTGEKNCGNTGDGCGLTIGFWKTHAVDNLYGHNPGVAQDIIDANGCIYLGSFPVCSGQAVVDVMKGVGSNGIAKLYAQMLAVKLNILNGSNDDCVAAALAAADAFLTGKSTDSWATLSKEERSQVLAWMSMFDQYNNGTLYVDGVLCVPHCD